MIAFDARLCAVISSSSPCCLVCWLQVQIYDLAGFKLSYVNGDMMQLFKVTGSVHLGRWEEAMTGPV